MVGVTSQCQFFYIYHSSVLAMADSLSISYLHCPICDVYCHILREGLLQLCIRSWKVVKHQSGVCLSAPCDIMPIHSSSNRYGAWVSPHMGITGILLAQIMLMYCGGETQHGLAFFRHVNLGRGHWQVVARGTRASMDLASNVRVNFCISLFACISCGVQTVPD